VHLPGWLAAIWEEGVSAAAPRPCTTVSNTETTLPAGFDSQVLRGSPLERHLAPGDAIVAVNGCPVRGRADWAACLAAGTARGESPKVGFCMPESALQAAQPCYLAAAAAGVDTCAPGELCWAAQRWANGTATDASGARAVDVERAAEQGVCLQVLPAAAVRAFP